MHEPYIRHQIADTESPRAYIDNTRLWHARMGGVCKVILWSNPTLYQVPVTSVTGHKYQNTCRIGCSKKTFFLNLTMALSLNIDMGNTNAIKKELGLLMHFLQSAARFRDFSTRF